MTITVKAAREALEAAQAAYISADIEHPTATHTAKEALTHARHEYWAACAALVERLPELLIGNSYNRDSLNHVYREITGENMP